MHDNQTILTELLHHKIAPPQELFVNAWGVIVAGGDSVSGEFGEINMGFIKEEWDASSLYFVKDAEVVPPPFVFENIAGLSKVESLSVAEKVPVKKIPSAGLWRYRAAAAILLLAVSGWVIYSVVNKQQGDSGNQAVNTSTKPAKPSTALPDSPGVATINSPALPDSTVTKGALPPSATAGNNKLTAKVSRSGKNVKSRVPFLETAENQFVGKDVLFTLVNFNTTQAERLVALLDKNAGRKITIDKYSYINVSDKMAEMLKTMYETKRNAKPTRKSRKAKERLEKWKQADEVNFDDQVKKNPLDIIDLSDFIFNK